MLCDQAQRVRVRDTMSLATAVRLKKRSDGCIVQDCDVYVGPKVKNTHWDLPRSKWANPYHRFFDKYQGMRLYRESILENKSLRKALLPELSGQRLGCFCDDLKHCHAKVLADLVNNKAESIVSEVPCGDWGIFFKGQLSPLSNLYRCKIQHDGETFMCLEQVRVYQMAKYLGETAFVKEVLLCKTVAQVLQLAKCICESPKNTMKTKVSVWNRNETIKRMYELLVLKWRQVTQFRNKLAENQGKIFLEATTSRFWGCGTDMDRLPTSVPLCYLPGSNILGWLLFILDLKERRQLLNSDEISQAVRTHLCQWREAEKRSEGLPPIMDGLRYVIDIVTPSALGTAVFQGNFMSLIISLPISKRRCYKSLSPFSR